MGKITFLNCVGDVTITWNENEDEMMKKHVQKLIDEGHIFFIIKRSCLIFKNKVVVENVSDITDKSLIIKDEKLASILLDVKSGKTVKQESEDQYDVEKVSTDPDEIVKGEVVCIKPSKGG